MKFRELKIGDVFIFACESGDIYAPNFKMCFRKISHSECTIVGDSKFSYFSTISSNVILILDISNLIQI